MSGPGNEEETVEEKKTDEKKEVGGDKKRVGCKWCGQTDHQRRSSHKCPENPLFSMKDVKENEPATLETQEGKYTFLRIILRKIRESESHVCPTKKIIAKLGAVCADDAMEDSYENSAARVRREMEKLDKIAITDD